MTDKAKPIILNPQPRDSSSKLIFSDNTLASQFLRDYADLEILRHIQPEDVEDVSERYVPLYSTERSSDTVKKVDISRYLPEKIQGMTVTAPTPPGENAAPPEKSARQKIKINLPLYVISLIEHKTKVEYNIGMQLLRYMVHIWEDYEKDMNKRYPGISGRKDFKYPPILPIVYYEGTGTWTAPSELADRILCQELLGKYLPNFQYQLITLHDYSDTDLLAKGDEVSLAMLVNKIQSPADVLAFINLDGKQIDRIIRDTPEHLLDTLSKVFRTLLYSMNLPEDNVEDAVSRIKERKMARLFENVTMTMRDVEDYMWAQSRAKIKDMIQAEVQAKVPAEFQAKILTELLDEILAEHARIQAYIQERGLYTAQAREEDLRATQKELETTQQELDTAQQELETTQQELDTAQQELNTTQQKLDVVQQEFAQERELYQHILGMSRRRCSDAEILESLKLHFALSEEQAQAKLQKAFGD